MIKFSFLILSSIMLFSCAEPTPTFYKLSSEGPLPRGGKISLGIGPILLPEYANRRNLVIASSPNRLEVVLSHRWAGAFDQSASQVLATNLGREFQTSHVQVYPWQRDGDIDYQVAVTLTEFLAREDGFVHMEAVWRVYALPGSKLLSTAHFTAKEPVLSRDYEAVVKAHSKLLARLSHDIAAQAKLP